MATASVKVTQILTRTEQAGPQGVGDTIVFTLVTDTPVVVEGRPQLILSGGGLATYSGVDAQGWPEFTYTVAAGQNAAGLAVTGLSEKNGFLLADNVRFGAPETVVTPQTGVRETAVADLNGDGKTDLLVLSQDGRTVSVLLGKGDGTFAAAKNVAFDNAVQRIVTGDFNGDGTLDIAGVAPQLQGLSIKLGTGNATFAASQKIVFDGPTSEYQTIERMNLQIADLDNDGRDDFVFIKTTKNRGDWETDVSNSLKKISINDDGTYVDNLHYIRADGGTFDVADLNGDGLTDLVSFNQRTLEVRFGSSDGTFALAGSAHVLGAREFVKAADLNGDGYDDLLVKSTLYSRIWLGDGKGGLTETAFNGEIGLGTKVMDVDGDGKVDLVTSNVVYRGKGDGTFYAGRAVPIPTTGSAPLLADVNGDGKPDMIVLSDGRIQVLSNTSFAPTGFDGTSLATAEGSRTGVIVDTAGPVVRGVAVSGPGLKDGTGILVTGQTATLTLTMSEAVTLTNAATLALALTNGATARYDAKASSATQLVFRYTVGLQQRADDLAVQGVTLNGAVIQDAAGNLASLGGTVGNPPGTLRIDGNTGTAGDDVFTLKSGAQTYRGLAGDDTYVVSGAGNQVFEAAGQGFDTVIARGSYTLAAGQEIEVLEGSGTSLRLVGNAFRQTILGTSGNDELVGKGGGDKLVGRQGDDAYFVRDSADRVYEAEGGGFDTVRSSGDYQLLAGQAVELLGANDEAGTAALRLTGNEFGQTLRGTAGANLLDGRSGADTLIGLGGDDTYVVDNAGDAVIERSGQGNDRILSSVGYTLAAGVEVETLQLLGSTGSKALNLVGNEFGQTLRGNAGANLLDGRGGADTLYGGAGDDTYRVDTVKDRVFEAKGQGTDTVLATTSYTLAAGQEIEALRLADPNGQTNLDLTGNEFANTLQGNAGANVLDGGAGADLLIGGRGQDAFVFSTKLGAGTVDRIADFAPVDDGIRLAKSIFAGLAPGPLDEAAFKDLGAAGARLDASDRILYDSKTGVLSYDADGSGKAAAITFAVLNNKASLTHDDFFVV